MTKQVKRDGLQAYQHQQYTMSIAVMMLQRHVENILEKVMLESITSQKWVVNQMG